jgi:hypothetical protein
MSRNIIFVLMYLRHKFLDLILFLSLGSKLCLLLAGYMLGLYFDLLPYHTSIILSVGCVNYCWPSPAQSILVSISVGTRDKTSTSSEMGNSLRREEGSH